MNPQQPSNNNPVPVTQEQLGAYNQWLQSLPSFQDAVVNPSSAASTHHQPAQPATPQSNFSYPAAQQDMAMPNPTIVTPTTNEQHPGAGAAAASLPVDSLPNVVVAEVAPPLPPNPNSKP